MNISSNNMKGLSQYSLLNKLFSQRNRNKAGTSNQIGATVSVGLNISTTISIITKTACHSIQKKKPTGVSKEQMVTGKRLCLCQMK